MATKQRKVFSSVREIQEAYFPRDTKRQDAHSPEHRSRMGSDLAVKLAREFQARLRR